MNMKGVSAVIATILMLLITIALAGTAYLYISGIFTAKTGVVLSIDGIASHCNSTHLVVAVKNDGSTVGYVASLSITKPDGTGYNPTCVYAMPLVLNAGSSNTTACTRNSGGSATTPSGSYAIVVSTGATSASGSIICDSAS